MSSSTKIILYIVALAMFMEQLDATIINTAIPVMAQSLQVNPIDLKIALISYLLSLAIFIPISGWVADKYGAKRVFIIAIAIFTVSSLWCGFAHNLPELVIARAIQGLGSALTLPVGRLIIFRSFARHKVVAILSQVVMLASFGLMLGPVFGGLITHYFSWHWIFWINIPVGLLTIIITQWAMTEIPPQAVPPFDKLGFILFGASLAGVTFGLSAFSESAIRFSLALLIMLMSGLLLILYIWYSRRQPYPVVNIQLFRLRTFQVATAGNLISRLGFGGVPFLLPILLQVGLGYSPQLAGFLVAPAALGVLAVKPLSVNFLRWLGYRKLLLINTLLVVLSLWNFIFIELNTSIYLIALFSFCFGFLISLQYGAMNSLGYAEIPTQQLSAATSIMGVVQQLTQSFGVAISALLIHSFSLDYKTNFVLTTTVFHRVFFALGFITLIASLIFYRLHPADGQQMIKN